MKTFVVEGVVNASVEEVFACCFADPAFKVKLHEGHSSGVDVSAWFPQGQEFRRVCFYTLTGYGGGTRCLETQRYRRLEDGGYAVHCAVVPEAAAGQALRVECEWRLVAHVGTCNDSSVSSPTATALVCSGEVECGGGKVWGAAALVEQAVVGPAKDAANALLNAAKLALEHKAAKAQPHTLVSSLSIHAAPPIIWHDFRHCGGGGGGSSGSGGVSGTAAAAAAACAPPPPLITACTPASLCPAALPTLLALTRAPHVRDMHGRTPLHAICLPCAPHAEPLRLATLRTLIAANADVAAVDDEVSQLA